MFGIDRNPISKGDAELGRFLHWDIDFFVPVDSYLLEALPKLPVQGVYLVTDLERRPELISYKIYGSTDYWWHLMVYNGIEFNHDIKTGDKLKYFALNHLQQIVSIAGQL